MYRVSPNSHAVPKHSGANADRGIGQLMRVTADGKATNVTGEDNLLYLPLVQPFKYATDQVAELQFEGIAKVKVDDKTGITAGVPVGPTVAGTGIRQQQEGLARVGIALATPANNGDYIPVLLSPKAPDSAVY